MTIWRGIDLDAMKREAEGCDLAREDGDLVMIERQLLSAIHEIVAECQQKEAEALRLQSA